MKSFIRGLGLCMLAVGFSLTSRAVSINETHVDVSCNGGNNGSIDITPFGGTAPYVYLWNDGVITEDRTNLTAGIYTITVTDLSAQTASLSITITEPTVLTVSLTAIAVSCHGGSNGAINTTRSGGTAPYSYLWNDGAFTQNRSGLTSGNYSITVTDLKGCTASATVFVPEPLIALSAIAIPSPLACVGGPSGSVVTSTSGGTPPYTYWWGGGVITPTRLNLFSGTYCVTATDANGCTANACATIPPYNPLGVSSTQTNNTCYGDSTGSIDLTVTDGSTPYTYAWTSSQATEDISNLKAGTYAVTVTDNNTCTISHTVTITQPSFPVSINSTISDPMCYGSGDGYINLNVLNGVVPYAYDWGSGITTQNRTGLSGGIYLVTVTDADGCKAFSSLTLNEPTPLTVSATHTDVACYDASTGTVTLTANGSFAPYSYDWNDGGDTQNRTGLAAGNYSVTLTDNHGCIASASAAIAQPLASLSASMVTGDVRCNGGNDGWINLMVTGGTTPYSYDWGSGVTSQNRNNLTIGNYSVTVTDSAGCTYSASAVINEPTLLITSISHTDVNCYGGNTGAVDLTVSGGATPYAYSWNSGASSQDLSNVPAANYSVTISDDHGCSATQSAFVTQPPLLTVSTSASNVSCNGGNNGSITVTPGGGVTTYTFLWNDGITTQNRSALLAGPYSVTVFDSHTCTVSASNTITEPTYLTASTVITNPTCYGYNNGSVDLSVSGGSGSYLFAWSNGRTTEDITGLTAGNYLVNITDANNCVTSVSAPVISPAVLQTNTSVTGIGCSGATAGSIDLTVTGGTTPYTYAWSNGSTSQDINNLSTGNYSVAITDDHGCSASASAAITAVPAINTSFNKTDVACYGSNTGAIDLTISGGVAPFIYAWSNSAVTEDLQGIAAGSYSVVVIDSNQCSATSTITIAQPARIQISSVVSPITCFGKNDGSIDITLTGGVPPFTYLWNHAAVTEDVSGLRSASYSITVTDANACTAKLTNIPVYQPSQIVVTTTSTPISCPGRTNGSIDVQVSGGSAPYTYFWNTQATTRDLNNLASGTYRVTVLDERSCSASAEQYVETIPAINIIFDKTNTACHEVATGAIALTVDGGSPAYSYHWDNGSNTKDLSNLSEGIYTVTVTDSKDCSSQVSFDINFEYVLTAGIQFPAEVTAGETMELSVTTDVNHGNTYAWLPAEQVQCASCQHTEATLHDNTTLAVTVTDLNGCTVTDSMAVEVKPVVGLFLPNTFTPNHDGANDVLELFGDKGNISGLNFMVFNRWGEKVFETNDHSFQWDGTFRGEDLPAGMYTYSMKTTRTDSSHKSDTGTVLLLR